MNALTHHSIRAAGKGARRAIFQSVIAAAGMLAGSTASGAQQPPAGRLWAAQTGIDQVTLAWDSVPGTAEYRVYLGDPSTPSTFTRPPVRRLRGHSRGTMLTGVQRAASGITLVAVDAGGAVLRQAAFNPVTPATFFPPATPPTGVTAQASGSDVVVTWDSVPGATGYAIGRSVHRSGFTMLCALCPNEGRYVDRNVMAGLPHTYNVAAIFPSGDVSRRVAASPVTPGAAQVATAPVITTPGVSPSSTPISGSPPGGSPPGAVPTAGAPPGVPTGTTPTTASVVTPPPIDTSVAPPPSVTATSTAWGVAFVNWQPSPTTGITGYIVKRRLNYLSGAVAWAELARVSPTEQSYTDRSFPLSTSGTVSAQYEVITTASAGSAGTTSNEIRMQAPDPAAVPTPAPGGGSVASCQLDYQRADNMWAPAGAPEGSLGTESITLISGQKQVFITDWKYEKLRNDGTSYYGSHLRVAINRSGQTIHLTVRGWVGDLLTGTSLRTYAVSLSPNTSKRLQADLVDVLCA